MTRAFGPENSGFHSELNFSFFDSHLCFQIAGNPGFQLNDNSKSATSMWIIGEIPKSLVNSEFSMNWVNISV
jgi:hypothetical protein